MHAPVVAELTPGPGAHPSVQQETMRVNSVVKGWACRLAKKRSADCIWVHQQQLKSVMGNRDNAEFQYVHGSGLVVRAVVRLVQLLHSLCN